MGERVGNRSAGITHPDQLRTTVQSKRVREQSVRASKGSTGSVVRENSGSRSSTSARDFARSPTTGEIRRHHHTAICTMQPRRDVLLLQSRRLARSDDYLTEGLHLLLSSLCRSDRRPRPSSLPSEIVGRSLTISKIDLSEETSIALLRQRTRESAFMSHRCRFTSTVPRGRIEGIFAYWTGHHLAKKL